MHALTEICCALLEDPEGLDIVLRSGASRSILRVFCSSWDLHQPNFQVSLLLPSEVAESSVSPHKSDPAGSQTSQGKEGDGKNKDNATIPAAAAAPYFLFSANPAAEVVKREQLMSRQLVGSADVRPMLHDHQGREHALDTFLMLLEHPSGQGLAALGACSKPSQYTTHRLQCVSSEANIWGNLFSGIQVLLGFDS